MQADLYPAPFIASSISIKENRENFLEMIMQNNCKIVVCLEVLVNNLTFDFLCFCNVFVRSKSIINLFL